jgi:hypothetical protein
MPTKRSTRLARACKGHGPSQKRKKRAAKTAEIMRSIQRSAGAGGSAADVLRKLKERGLA